MDTVKDELAQVKASQASVLSLLQDNHVKDELAQVKALLQDVTDQIGSCQPSPPSIPAPPFSPDQSSPIPDDGAAVLDGGTGDQLYCLLPRRDETTTTAQQDGAEKNIAVQCCVQGSSDDAGCKRYIDSDPDDCLAGKPPVAKTYEQAAAICAARSTSILPLGLCDRSCASMGCQYNQFPVFTNKPCVLNRIPDGGVQIVRGDGTGDIQCLKPGQEDDVLMSPWPNAGDEIRYVAIQCCVEGSTNDEGCRRFTGTESNVDTCVAGLANAGGIKAFTYSGAVAKCTTLGSEVGKDLRLCSQSCAGKGCAYNFQPVLTTIPC